MDTTPHSCYPLSQAATALIHRWYIPPLAALSFALVSALITSFFRPVYESHVMLRVNYRAEIQTLTAMISVGGRLMTPAERGQQMEHYAEEFVHLTGNRILRENQSMEQFLTSYQINTLARLAKSDSIKRKLWRDLPRWTWVVWEAKDKHVLPEERIRVRRSKPESVVEVCFRSLDTDSARKGAEILGAVLIKADEDARSRRRQALLDDAEHQVATASKAVDELTTAIAREKMAFASAEIGKTRAPDEGTSKTRAALEAALASYKEALENRQRLAGMRNLLNEPAIEKLESASAPVRISPTPTQTDARAALAGFLIAVLLVAVFPGRASGR